MGEVWRARDTRLNCEVAKNSRLLRELDPREIKTWKGQPGKDMIVFGSGSIVSQLTHHGLIDDISSSSARSCSGAVSRC